MSSFSPIQSALEDLRQGRMLILVDDDSREQEGDVIIAADKITPEAINFMIKHFILCCLLLTGVPFIAAAQLNRQAQNGLAKRKRHLLRYIRIPA